MRRSNAYRSSVIERSFGEYFAQRQSIRGDIVIPQRIRLVRIVQDAEHPCPSGRMLAARQKRKLRIDSPNWKEVLTDLGLESVCHCRRVRIFHNRGQINHSNINHIPSSFTLKINFIAL